jgi:hypothetical protein
LLKPKARPKPKKRPTTEKKEIPAPDPFPEVVLPTTTIPVQSYLAAPSAQFPFPVTTSYQQPLMQQPLMTTATPIVEQVMPMQSAPMPLLGATASMMQSTPMMPMEQLVMPMQSTPMMPVPGGTAFPAYSAVGGYPAGSVY